jgi:hypothetical protein
MDDSGKLNLQARRPGFRVPFFRLSQPVQNLALFLRGRAFRERAIRLRSGDLARPRGL